MPTSTGSEGAAVSYRGLLTDVRLLTIVAVSFMGMFGANLASPTLPRIAGSLGVPEAEVGLVMSAYFLPAVVMVPVVGVFADIYGRRRLVLTGIALFGVSGTAIGFVEEFELLLALRVVQGIGFAGMSPLAITVIGDLYVGPEGSTAQGIRGSAHGLAGIVAPAIAGFLADIAWNYPFFLYALAIPAFLLVLVYLPETGQPSTTTVSLRSELRGYWSAIRTEATDRDLGILLVGTFVAWLLKSTVVTFVPLFVVGALGGTAFVAGLILSFRGVVRFLVSPLSGSVVVRTGYKWGLLAVMAFAGAVTLLVPAAPTALWLAALVGAYGAGNALLSAILNDTVTTMASPEHRGGIVAGVNTMKQAGNVTAPVVFGVLLAVGGFGILFATAGVLMLGYAGIAAAVLDARIGDGRD